MRLIILIVFMPLLGMAQQKAMFTQYMFNGLVINPAYSAMDEAANITAVSRHQWVGFSGSPNTQTVSFHTPVKLSNTSVGVLLLRDQIGEVLTDNGAFLTAAQRIEISRDTYLALGVNGGICQLKAGYSELYDDVSGADPMFANENSQRFSMGFGLMLFSRKFFAGLSSPFFYESRGNSAVTVKGNKAHYLLQGGLLTPLNSNLLFKPTVLLKYVKGSPVEADLNASVLLKQTIWIGASWRSFDSVDILTRFYITKYFDLGYSYDFTTTKLTRAEKGSHEIALSCRIPVKGRNFPPCYF